MKFCKACGAETTKMYCNERCRSAYRRNQNKVIKPLGITDEIYVTDFDSPNLTTGTFTDKSNVHNIEPCYFDDCDKPSKDSVTFQPPGLKKYHMHLRVATCEVHAHLLKEVA